MYMNSADIVRENSLVIWNDYYLIVRIYCSKIVDNGKMLIFETENIAVSSI